MTRSPSKHSHGNPAPLPSRKLLSLYHISPEQGLELLAATAIHLHLSCRTVDETAPVFGSTVSVASGITTLIV
jgi:hypothetical protein